MKGINITEDEVKLIQEKIVQNRVETEKKTGVIPNFIQDRAILTQEEHIKLLLNHYSKKYPSLFFEFDLMGKESCSISPTYELMSGIESVRVLIKPNTDFKWVARNLRNLADDIDSGRYDFHKLENNYNEFIQQMQDKNPNFAQDEEIKQYPTDRNDINIDVELLIKYYLFNDEFLLKDNYGVEQNSSDRNYIFNIINEMLSSHSPKYIKESFEIKERKYKNRISSYPTDTWINEIDEHSSATASTMIKQLREKYPNI